MCVQLGRSRPQFFGGGLILLALFVFSRALLLQVHGREVFLNGCVFRGFH